MAFDDEVSKTNSERFTLFRVTPARLLTPTKSQNGTVTGGKIFEADFPFDESRLERFELSGTVETKVIGTPTAIGEWSYNAGKIQWVEPNNPSGFDWQAVIFYNLFYTSGLSIITNANPGDTGTPEVSWEPRLTIDPITNQDSSQLISGFLTTTISQVTLANHDQDIQQYLTEYDSFNQKDANVWIVANGLANFQRVYTGRVRQIQFTPNDVTFQLFDILSLLDQPSLMGDSVSEAYYSLSSSSNIISAFNGRLSSEDEGKAIPYFMGPSSTFANQDFETSIIISSSNRYLDFEDDSSAVTAILDVGTYTYSELASEIAIEMNNASTALNPDFECQYSSVTNKWTILSNPPNTTLTLKWSTGLNSANSIGFDIGFDVSSDSTGSLSYDSDFPRSAWNQADSPTDMTPAVCIEYDSVRSTTRNRKWGVGRIHSSGLKTIDPDYVSTASLSVRPLADKYGNPVDHMYWTVGANNNCEIGDTFRITNGPNSSYHRVVWRGDTGETFPFGGASVTNYEMITEFSGTWPGGNGTVSEAEAVTVIIKDENGIYWHPISGRDYTIATTTLDSGNLYVTIDFANNFEVTLGKPNAVAPDTDEVTVRVGCASNTNHADALKLICETAGIPVDTAGFTTASTDLIADVQFSMPEIDKITGDFESFRHYAELIAKSTLSFLTLDTNFQLSYQIVQAPPASLSLYDNVDETNYANLSLIIDYNDIVTEIDSFNLHNNSDWARRRTSTPAELRTDNGSRYLNNVNKSTRYPHVLAQISSRIDDLFNVLKNRRATYQYEGAPKELAANIGDPILLTSDAITGGDATKKTRIVAISKSSDKVIIKLSDLLGL